jgi:uncharacterized membrane protein
MTNKLQHYTLRPPIAAKKPTIDLRCCACGDARLKKLSLIYMEGTTKTRNTALAFYRGFSRQAIITSAGTRQSLLAQRAAPPRKKSPFLRGVIWFLAASVLALILHSEAATVCVLAVAALAGGLHIRDAYEYNTTKWTSFYNRWNRSFLCRQCGTVTVFY